MINARRKTIASMPVKSARPAATPITLPCSRLRRKRWFIALLTLVRGSGNRKRAGRRADEHQRRDEGGGKSGCGLADRNGHLVTPFFVRPGIGSSQSLLQGACQLEKRQQFQ